MKKTFLLLLVANMTYLSLTNGQTSPSSTTVGDFLKNPVGNNLENLCFNWKLPLRSKPTYQTAYQIKAATSPDLLLGKADIWDSGKMESADSIRVPYGGPKLKSGQRVYWTVRFWNDSNEVSEWSPPAFFETGLLSNAEWKDVFWIKSSLGLDDKITRPAYLRKVIELKDKPVKARLYMTTRGIAESRINAKKVGDDFWSTGWTDYRKRIQANTYDVTGILKSGKNTLSAIIADGWYSGTLGWSTRQKRAFYGERPEYAAILIVEYPNGETESFPTDASWQCSQGPLLEADIYNGETYDATLQSTAWPNAIATEKVSESKVAVDPRRNTPIRTMEVLEVQNITEPKKGVFVFDFGQNIAGVPSLKFPAKANQKVKIRVAEMLNQDGTLYTDNYRTAKSTDYYTAAKDGEAEYTPTFTYHGFRYVELSGLPEGIKPEKSWMKAWVWYNDMPTTGEFLTSNEKLNRLQSCILWGQKGNFFSTPTDCPQRDERLGWTGDAQVFAPTAAFNMDVSAFFTKWLVDMRDSQYDNGVVPHVVPTLPDPSEKNWQGSGAWSDACVICPWVMYLSYGDKKVLSDNYSMMKRWVDYQESSSLQFLRPEYGYGDWLQPYMNEEGGTPAPKEVIGTAYFAYTAHLLSEIARILGHEADAARYARLSQNVKDAFVKAYVAEGSKIKSDSQTAYLLALAFDILPEDMREAAVENLLEAIKRAGGHLRTGFVGTPLINNVLSRFGRTKDAYAMLLRETYPGWLFTVNQGATTMWERWNSYTKNDGFGDASMNSFNHYAYGAIGQWMYEKVGGLSPSTDPLKPAYKETLFAPELGGNLTSARSSLETPYGHAESSWSIKDGKMSWKITIAPNTSGKIVFPTNKAQNIRISGESLSTFAKENNIEVASVGERLSLSNLQNGSYMIEVDLK